MSPLSIAIVGGGAAGCFAAITCAEANPAARVIVLERAPTPLGKVRISGGGRCNVTHSCFDGRELTTRYPRGSRALIGAFQRFQPRDTVAWFAARGVTLKTEADGRMFPTTDTSQTIIDCLLAAARSAGVVLRTNCGVDTIVRAPAGGFTVTLTGGETLHADRVLLATGGCRAAAGGALAVGLGHTLQAPVPSLFTLHIEQPGLKQLAGVAVDPVEVTVPGTKLRERGPLLITHWGVSGPAILRLSAWGARALHELEYRFPLRINWLPELDEAALSAAFDACRQRTGTRQLNNTPVGGLPARWWEHLLHLAGLPETLRWADLTRAHRQQLTRQLTATEWPVTGKSLNKDEFVTCGGVTLGEVNFKTMESRICPGLHFAGELLDVDGITGGFNFQAAWTTGWLAGNAMAAGPAPTTAATAGTPG